MVKSPRADESRGCAIPANLQAADAVQYHSQIASGWESNYASEQFQIRVKVVDELLGERELRGQYWLDAGVAPGHSPDSLPSTRAAKCSAWTPLKK
jgi:hypothetical protein